ncbi:hypothetical protein [Winogradskyella forsetii]|uniref:hypothetical protein n=1 Tax=Winogradskyella forsetii TaxID=2686077 RepID=UPI0015B8B31A|nr:hypothetical protein [Winogradskyella forsetii]
MKKDNIDKIYSELEMFSKAPPEELWDNIEARLHPKKKKRRLFFIWGSAAAVLMVFLGYMFTSSPVPNGIPVNTTSNKEQSTDNGKSTDDAEMNKLEEEATKIVKGTDLNNANEDVLVEQSNEQLNTKNDDLNPIASQKQSQNTNEIFGKKEVDEKIVHDVITNHKKENSNYNNSYSQNTIKEKTSYDNDSLNYEAMPQLKEKNKNIINVEKDKAIASIDSIAEINKVPLLELTEELVAQNENASDSIINKVTGSPKWSVEVLGGLSNTASEASIQGESVNTTSQNDFIYALKVGYAISDRIVVKSGVGKNILGQEINNLLYVSSDASLSADNSQSIISNQEVLIFGSQESVENSFTDISTSGVFINEGTLQQQFDYIQVPLEVSYKVLKAQKFDVSLGLGGNMNFLTNNRAFLDDEQIGESLNVNSTIFGATLNTNMSYELAKKTILFLEPSYNYFEKPIDNNNQAFNNTQLRVLFGLRYMF